MAGFGEGFLGSLGRGFSTAGAILSPAVDEQQAKERLVQQEAAARQLQAMQALVARGMETGAVDPAMGARYGLEGFGPDAKTKRLQRIDEELRKLVPSGDLTGAGGGMTSEQLFGIAQRMAIAEHPGAVGLTEAANRLKAREDAAKTLGTMRSQLTADAPAATEADAVQRINAGGGAPMSIGTGANPNIIPRAAGGATDFLQDSPYVGAAAKSLQKMIDSGAPGMDPQRIEAKILELSKFHQSAVQARSMQSALFGQQDKRDQFRVDNPRPVAPQRAPVGYRYTEDGATLEKIPGGPAAEKDKPVNATLSPEAVSMAADRYRIDGTLPPNLGRGTQGTVNTVAILDEAAAKAKAQGMDGEAERLSQIGNKAISAALGPLERQRANIMTFEKTALGGAKIALEMSDKVDRDTGIPLVDRWVQAGRKSLSGDVDVTRLHNAVETFTNEYAKVMSGSSGGQATTVSMQQHAREMLNGAFTKEQFSGTIDLMRREMQETREKAFDNQIAEMKSRIKSPSASKVEEKAASVPAATPAAAPASGWNGDKEKRYQELLRKRNGGT